MLVLLQGVAAAVVPLNVTRLFPWLLPKFVPVIVTDVPTGPDVGFILVIVGAGPQLPPGRKVAICMNQFELTLFVAMALIGPGVVSVWSSTRFPLSVDLAVKPLPALSVPVSPMAKPKISSLA
jgi:hypothetical protein